MSVDEEDDTFFDMLNDLRDVEVVGSSGVRQEDNNENMPIEELRENYISMFEEAQRELYSGCTSFSAFNFLVKLMHVKLNGWSNKSFNILFQLLREVFSKPNTIPRSHCEAKKMLRDLKLGYESIHACKNKCILFWDEHEGKDICSMCKEPRFNYDEANKKKILQKLFLSKHIANDMRWHKEKNVETYGVLRHPTDVESWKEFYKLHETFVDDPRNVHLGLATDGFNMFRNMSNAYSMWAVLLVLGPKAPGKEIDVYLHPLINELKELWSEGIEAYDATAERIFQLHAIVMWTIHDFPAYETMFGWSTKGYNACLICLEDTVSQRLRSKICYAGHRRFLYDKHLWRKTKNALPEVTFGKDPMVIDKRRRSVGDTNWVKKSIFFELEYWSDLKLRYNLDVMYIEKNICDALVDTLLSIDRKSKNMLKARLYMQDMGIRSELHLKKTGDRVSKPHASYTFTLEERHEFCLFLKSAKFPDGYASNISRNVNVNNGKLYGLKKHDCRVLLQRLLLITIRKFLLKDICGTSVEICDFFKKHTSRTLHVVDLSKLEEDIIFILCKLKRIFPRAFFDIMVHLAIHLPREAILAGLVSLRRMYPFERYLETLKKYVHNIARPEGSIAEKICCE
ncbi:hypothetical protein Pfo_026840 [Paulownia fortunei]|nr:hypothetical protein Pfo_026840 [Paulownia fortunei]